MTVFDVEAKYAARVPVARPRDVEVIAEFEIVTAIAEVKDVNEVVSVPLASSSVVNVVLTIFDTVLVTVTTRVVGVPVTSP